MFGGTLAEILDIQKDKFPNRRLPWILTTLTDQILGRKEDIQNTISWFISQL